MLHHPNCVEMPQSFYKNGDKPDEVYLNVVMDYIQDTVYRVMKNYLKMKQMVPNLIVKLYSY
jgi:glycogen synthase kinase 3 beta